MARPCSSFKASSLRSMAVRAPRLRAAAKFAGPATTWLFGTALVSTSASASATVT